MQNSFHDTDRYASAPLFYPVLGTIGFVFALVVPRSVLAQSNAAQASQMLPPLYVIRPLRWEEDYGQFVPLSNSGFPQKWKHIDLRKGYASIGGEARLRIDSYQAPLFGLRSAQDFTSTQWRGLLHGDYHPNAHMRAFVQLSASDERGRKPIDRPVDETALDIAQGFVDLQTLGASPWRLRVGRQELAFGRYITTRDGTNLRRTFDGARLTGPFFRGTLDVVAANLTQQKSGTFDDRPDKSDRARGAAYVHPIGGGGRITTTWFGRYNGRANYVSGFGKETRQSLAFRYQGTHGAWDFDGQISRQWGGLTAGNRHLNISAWGFATETGYTLSHVRWTPRLAIRVDAASGDENPLDNKLGTFDLAYPNITYISDAGAFSPRNVSGIQPFVMIKPTSGLTLTLGADFLRPINRGDGLYAPGSLLIRISDPSRLAASQYYLRGLWAPTRHWELSGSAVLAKPEGALHDAGGRDQKLLAIQLATRF